jgi:hypothetical protein
MKKLTPEQIDILTNMLEIQFSHAKTRFEIQFQTFTWWASLLITGIGAFLLEGKNILAMNFPHWVFIIVSSVLLLVPIIPGIYIIRQSRYYWGNMQIIDRIENSLGLFEEGVFIEGNSILPSEWKRHLKVKKPKLRDNWFAWFYIVVLYVLSLTLAILIFYLGIQ